MTTTRFFDTVESFEEALFYFSLDTLYVKSDPEDDDYSLVIIKNGNEKLVCRVSNDYLEDREFEYDLNVVHLNNYNE